MKFFVYIALIFSCYLQAESSLMTIKGNDGSKSKCTIIKDKLWKTRFAADEVCKYSSSKCINNSEENILVVCDSSKVSLCYEERKWLKGDDFVMLPSTSSGKGNATNFQRINGVDTQKFCVFY